MIPYFLDSCHNTDFLVTAGCWLLCGAFRYLEDVDMRIMNVKSTSLHTLSMWRIAHV